MFERLFGNTVEEQLSYLQPRIMITAPVIIIGLLGMVFGVNAGLLMVIAAYVWGWDFMKRWFGATTIGALFSGNIVIGVIIAVAYLCIGYIIGLIVFMFGLIRYIQLKFVDRK